MKKFFRVAVIVVILIVIISFIKSKSTVPINSNQNGNISNMGLAVANGDVIYYNKYEKGIFARQKGEEKQLTDETAYSMQIKNNKIYYLTVANFNNVIIKSIDITGENLKDIYTIYTAISKIYVDNENIYFVSNKDDSGIKKVDLNGKNETSVVSGNIKDFQVVGDKIFYINESSNICMISKNGKKDKILNEEIIANKFQVVDNWIYYYNQTENALFRINQKGTVNELISVLVKNETYNVAGEYVYYFDSDNQKISRMKIGKSNKCDDIVNVNVVKTKINIANDEIYYLDESENKSQTYQMYRAKIDGKEINKIEY